MVTGRLPAEAETFTKGGRHSARWKIGRVAKMTSVRSEEQMRVFQIFDKLKISDNLRNLV